MNDEIGTPPGLTDDEWQTIRSKSKPMDKLKSSFNIGDVLGSSPNPIVSLFATLLK